MMFDGEVFFSLAAIGNQALCAAACVRPQCGDCRARSPAKRCQEEMK